MTVSDIYYILFRHKWRIGICTLVGCLAAAAVYKLQPPPFESSAKLYIRYVLTDARNLGPAAFDRSAKSPDERGETILNSEVEMLTSYDLLKQVAEAVGPAKLLPKSVANPSIAAAATVISNGLTVTAPMHSSIIYISYKHKNADVVQPVLRELVNRYYKMQSDVHQSKGMLGDFLIQQSDQLRARLMQTEEDLRKARERAGVVSIEDARNQLAGDLGAVRQQIFKTQAELAERTSIVREYASHQSPEAPKPDAANAAPIPPAKSDEYAAVSSQSAQLQKFLEQLLTQFTPENPRVQEVRSQLTRAEAQKRALEVEYPSLAKTVVQVLAPVQKLGVNNFDPAAAAADIAALKAKLQVLNSQSEQLRAEAGKFDQIESEMSELRRKKELDETNYKLFAASLEQNRISEALSNGRISNISEIQSPSPPIADWSKATKIVAGIAIAGFAIGIGWAFLIELYLDQTIKRATDVERNLKLPLFLTLPVLSGQGKNAPLLTAGSNAGDLAAAENEALTPRSELEVFHETLRDRLIGYFESRGLVHKPKLVAVTGLTKGAGVTTTAAGLARSLSETGEGNVLLVDLTAAQGSSQQFVKGKAVCGIDELLDARHNAQVETNLFVVAESSNSEQLTRNMPQRFTKLVPKLKASDFDYIVFDMPTVNQISITPRMAGFMDMVLMVIESEKTNRDVVQRATALLAQSKAHVGVVLNKAKQYVPARLQPDLLTCV